MGNSKRLTFLFALALAAIALFAVPAGATDNGSRDADADGASNTCEHQAATNPSVADSDGDTVVDGDEDSDGDGATDRAESNLHSNCGKANSHRRIRRATVTSYDPATLALVLTVRGGGTVTAPVSDTLRCRVKSATHGSVSHGDGNKKSAGSKLTKCTAADLVAGTKVQKAKIKGGKYVEIRLIK